MLFRRKSDIKRSLYRKIINTFLGIGLSFFFFLLIAFGFSQTSSFRDWLKNLVVDQVNSSTNGKLTIGRLDGTIFTSLILTDVKYTLQQDTILSADKMELKVSPLRILLKTIYLRKLEIDNANIAFLKDENGILNVSKISTPAEEKVIEDSVKTSTPFNWKIDIADLDLNNINFKLQSFQNINSNRDYPNPNLDDLRLDSLNLSLSAIADIPKNEFQLYINRFSVKPNITGFRLLNLSGKFILLNDIAGIVDLSIITDRSQLKLDAAVSDFTPFSDDNFDISTSPIKFELDAGNLNFDDLTNFINGTEILKGNVQTRLNVEGTLNELAVNNLEVNFSQTSLNAAGFLQNITDGGKMNIEMNFYDSFVNQDDVNNLLPELNIPIYKDYGVLQFDSLSFSGQPLNFTANMLLTTEKGKVNGLVKMDLTGDEIIYDYQITTTDLDLMPVAGINTNLNLAGSLKGKGFSPETLETNILINAGASTIQGISFNEFNIDAQGSNGLINTEVSFSSLETKGSFQTHFNFTDTTSTKYNFDIVLNGFNISDFASESNINSDLNISFKGEGENFDQENLNLFAILEIGSSSLNDIELDSVVLIADVRSELDTRVINIISDLADLTITGKYSISEMIDLIVSEVDILSTSIEEKISRIQPPKFDKSFVEEKIIESLSGESEKILSNKNLDVQYLLELKSFELVSLFLGDAQIEIDGEISGKLYSSADTTYLNLETKIDQLSYWDGFELYILYNFDFALSMMNGPSLRSFDDFYANAEIKAERIFFGSEISNLSFNLNFNNNKARIKLNTVYDEKTSIDLDGLLVVNDDIVDVSISKLNLMYKDFTLNNSDDIEFSYSNDKFIFKSFVLFNEQAKLDLNGQLSFNGQQDLTLRFSNLSLKNISTGLLQLDPGKEIEGEINIDFAMTGSSDNPVIKLDFNIDSIKVQNYQLGSLESSMQYAEKILSTNLNFLERKNNQPRKSLGLKGTIPIDLSFNSIERFDNSKPLEMIFLADNFDLRFTSSFIPGVSNFNGFLNGSVTLDGYPDDIRNSGELTIANASFLMELTNLTYLFDAKMDFENEKIILSSLNLSNESKINNGGTMYITGQIDHDFINIQNVNIKATGSLKVLDDKSRAVNPSLFGNITIATRNDIVFLSSEDRSYLGLDLILNDGASITYSPPQTAFSNENDKFTYVFFSGQQENLLEQEIDSLIILSELKKQEKNLAQRIPFNFDLRIEVEKEAKVVFVLSREFKQNLTAYLGGSLEYSVINEIPFARGELTLLDGSKLDFIKTFQAEGNIRFIDELEDPYINVVATYESFYNPDTLSTGLNDYDVQIRIILEGTAEEITSNFLKGENNIEVYKSRRNANQFELDPAKTSSDAMFFIIANTFPEDATLQQANLVASTLNSFAGSVIGTILNEQFGDIVRTVNIQKVGEETVFSLVGKVEEFRYEIGGTSQVFQDLTRATVKIEHPLFFPNFVVRFYRTEPPYQSSTYSEMINELGLKYSFVF